MARDIVTNLIANDRASRPIEKVGRAARESAGHVEHLSIAEQRLALEVEKADVRVAKATRALTNAQQRYGEESLQAKEASNRLTEAQLDLAAAEEKVKHKADDAVDSLRKVKREAREAGEAQDELSTKTKESGEAAEKTGGRFQRMLSPMRGIMSVTGGLASRFGGIAAATTAWGSSIGGALGPMALFGSRAVLLGAQVGQIAAAIAPAAASLPGLVGGFELLKGTIGLAGPAIAKAMSPITEALVGHMGKVDGKQTLIGGLREQVGELASKGLPALSRGFLRVNFPTIADAMRRIARATDSVLVSFGKWANSIGGQRAIRGVVEGTAQAAEDLAPHISGLAVAFGNLIGAAGPAAFERVSKLLGWAADGVGKFLGSITRQDVNAAWAKIDSIAAEFPRVAGAVAGIASKFAAFGHALLDVGNWMNTHRADVKRYSDVLAGVGIAAGILSGGVIPVLIGALTLVTNHWDAVTGAVSGAVGWFKHSAGASDAVTTAMGMARHAVADLSSWWSDHLMPALRTAGNNLLPHIRGAISDVTKAFHDHRDIVDKAQRILSALGVVLTKAVIPAVGILAGAVTDGLGGAFSGLIVVLDKAVLPGLRMLIHGTLDVFGTIINGAADLFGWVPGVGPELKKAAAHFNQFQKDVNNALNGITDQTVGVKVVLTPSGAKLPSWYGTTAGMGGHAAGGLIRGPGGPRDDMVPALLSNGEYVVNAAATQRHRGLLESINANRYAFGGFVMSESLTGLQAARQAELGLAAKMAARMPLYAPSGPGGGRRPGGISDPEWYVISRESGGRTTAQNPTSTAFGLGQLLLANRVHYGRILGVSPSTTDFGAQLAMFRMYVADRYGTAANAASFWRAHHWYGNGGVISEPVLGVGMRSGQTYGFGERGPETVTPGRMVRGGGTTVIRHDTTVNVEVGASAHAIKAQIIAAVRDGVRTGELAQAVLPPGTRG